VQLLIESGLSHVAAPDRPLTCKMVELEDHLSVARLRRGREALPRRGPAAKLTGFGPLC